MRHIASRLFSKSGLVAVLILATFLCTGTASSATPGQYNKAESTALLEYARGCLLARLNGATVPAPPDFATKQQRACFVTFFKNKRVFACYGGFSPRRANLAEEIAENVRMALKNDPRCRTVGAETVQTAGIQITFPQSQTERVADYRGIDPLREGMFVESSDNGVAFVPGEARTAHWAFREALSRLKASDPATVRVYRFKATAISTRNN